jgi:penicillin-binding protein 1A
MVIKDNKRAKFILWSGILIVLIFILTLSVSGYFINSVKNGKYGEIPDYSALQNIRNHVASEIYSADGALLGKYYLVNRTHVKWDEISPHIINALLATEDIRFFSHEGIDKRSLARVLVKSLLLQNERSGGGSTISQQLAKNLFPRKKYPHLSIAINKIKEAIIAHRLENIYSKEEILTMYLNTVSFGEDVFGIEVAAERYFSTTPSAISISEAAVLIGMLKATTSYNPRMRPENALRRRNIVLNQMVKYQFLDAFTADSIKNELLHLRYNYLTHNEGLAPYFREGLRLEVQKWLNNHPKPDGTSYNLHTDGLKIHTTLNSKIQQYAEEALKGQLKTLQEKFFTFWKKSKTHSNFEQVVLKAKYKSGRYKALKSENFSEEEINKIFETPVSMKLFGWDGEFEKVISPLDSIRYYQQFLNAGMLVMEPTTGNVLAWVGGIDYKYFKYDHVRSKRQVGSTFKPLVYAAAIENGIDPCDYISNERTTYENYENWSPVNSNGDYQGYYSMQGGLVKSLNTVTTKLMMQTGTSPVINLARKMGITSELPDVPSLALGTAAVSLEEMTAAYTTFPNRGYRTNPVYIEKIEDINGNIVADFMLEKPSRRKAMEEETADIMTHFLKCVIDSGTAASIRYKYGLNYDIAGKTGTTQRHADGWFIGFTPDILAGVWVGHEDPRVHFSIPEIGQGSKMALPIWANFFIRTIADSDFEHLKKSKFSALSQEAAAKINCPSFAINNPASEEGVLEMIFGKRDREIRKSRKQFENKRERKKKQAQEVEKKSFWDRFKRQNKQS